MSSTRVYRICSLYSLLLFTLYKLPMVKGGPTIVCIVGHLKLARLLLPTSDMCLRLVDDRVNKREGLFGLTTDTLGDFKGLKMPL